RVGHELLEDVLVRVLLECRVRSLPLSRSSCSLTALLSSILGACVHLGTIVIGISTIFRLPRLLLSLLLLRRH
ncbi:hypothetical protein PMAYCL1PPCAC_30531, partial [Pristionchus mayeri]